MIMIRDPDSGLIMVSLGGYNPAGLSHFKVLISNQLINQLNVNRHLFASVSILKFLTC